jgi:predicted pyridoxine 5'-phosphate oxidase superfamily flavin-nucleotide-binding protein
MVNWSPFMVAYFFDEVFMVDNKSEQNNSYSSTSPFYSPFHRGEQLVQAKLGVKDKMEKFGSRVIRDHMPEQHRDFYQQLPYIFVGFADQEGAPWASILCNPAGFINSPDNQTLHINSQLLAGDPLAEALLPGVAVGLLGIELSTRRRNRLATK